MEYSALDIGYKENSKATTMNPRVKRIEEDSMLSAVSKCLEDALEAGLRRAFEVALEIAMTEVRRVTSQIHDQIHDTQQENIILRLQHIYAEHDSQNGIESDHLGAGNVREAQDTCVGNSNMNKEKTSDPDKKFKTDHTRHTHNIQHFGKQDPLSSEPVFERVKVKNENTEPEEQGPSTGDASEISLSFIGCASLFSTPFDGLHQSGDKTSLTQLPQNCREVRTNVQSKLYDCKFCGHAFHSESDQHNHHIQYHKTVLKGKGVNPTRTKKKKQQHFPPGCSPFYCTVCNQRFKRLENLNTHLRIHTGERPYPCSVCGVRFRHAGVLTRHFRIHTGEKPYICSECGKSFRNCGSLRFHQKSHNQVNPEKMMDIRGNSYFKK